MKKLLASLMLGATAFGSAIAADYSVGIVNLGTGFPNGAGTALTLYSITNKGIEPVKGSPYVLPQSIAPSPNDPYEPALVSVTADQNYAYVVYIRRLAYPPIVVQFAITPRGLVYEWQQPLYTGDPGLQSTTISTSGDYLVAYTYPADLWVYIFDQWGQLVVSGDAYENFQTNEQLLSGRIDPTGKFYYSCRGPFPTGSPNVVAANAVAVYTVPVSIIQPLMTTTDPVFVQSVCD